MSDRYSKLDQLGQQNALPNSPDEAVLERVKNPCDEPYMVRLVAPEFTSICPVTGQPDFAHLVVDYCPDEWIVESKAFKLFLGSFRNHGDFHEACTTGIGRVLSKKLARNGSVLAVIGIRAAAYQLMSSTNMAKPQRVFGFQTKVYRLIEAAVRI